MNKKFIGLILVVISLVMIGSGSYIYINTNNIETNNNVDENNEDKSNNNQLTAIDENESNGKVVKEKTTYITDDTIKYDTPNDTYSIEGINYDEENNKLVFTNIETNEIIGEYICKTNEKGSNYCNVISLVPVIDKYNLEEPISSTQEHAPVLDNRYIFIKDSTIFDGYGLSYSEKNPVILYDLKQQKELGRYTGVKDNIVYDNSVMIVKDNNNNWGLISINNGVVSTILKFEYEYIGTLNGLYMMVKDNLYYVYNPKTAKTIGPFNNEIASMNNSLIVTNEGLYKDNTENNYRLYTIEGKKLIINQGNKYIQLIDDFALVVDSDNKLSIYKNDGTKLTNDKIQLNNSFYSIRRASTDTLAYNATIENNTLTIEVNSANSTDIIETYKYNIATGEKTN